MNAKSCKGFTLVETVIVTAIAGATMLALSALLFSFNRLESHGAGAIGSAESARMTFAELESLALPASRILASRSFSGTAYASASTSLVLEIPSVDAEGQTLSAYDYAAFYVASGTAYRLLEADAGSSRIGGVKRLSGSVQSLTFSYGTNDFSTATTVAARLELLPAVSGDAAHAAEAVFRLRNF